MSVLVDRRFVRRMLAATLLVVLCSLSEARDQQVLSELEASFERDVVSAWYPKSIDEEHGGYVTGLDSHWIPTEETDKFLVGQARDIWVLARLASFKKDQAFAKYAQHGFRFLVDVMWDKENGGFFALVSEEGEPFVDAGKSAYGMSFAIYALSSLYLETHDAEALEFAKQSFLWLEAHSWDPENGGYVDDLTVKGEWSPMRIDGIDAGILGAKDYNSSIHLLESLTVLYQVWPDARVRLRLEQMLEILRDRFVQERGYLHLIFDRDWNPVSMSAGGRDAVMKGRYFDHVSWGHDVETAFLMLEAAHALYGSVDSRTQAIAKKLVDHALETGWDDRLGSLYEGGYYFDESGPPEVIMPKKVWWIAAESMNATLLMSQLYPDEPKYYEAFEIQWAYIKKYLIDSENGGWMATGLDSDAAAAEAPKAFRWKANYHDARAYMNCIEMLRGEFPLTQH